MPKNELPEAQKADFESKRLFFFYTANYSQLCTGHKMKRYETMLILFAPIADARSL